MFPNAHSYASTNIYVIYAYNIPTPHTDIRLTHTHTPTKTYTHTKTNTHIHTGIHAHILTHTYYVKIYT